MTPVSYHEAAEAELLSEIGYLEVRAGGLGRRFFAEVRWAEQLIARFPESGEEILPGIRKRMLRKFRCSLIYALEKEGVLILAVAHQSRRPGYWVGRITPSESGPQADT
ncbi:MAG: type II toxin-antitoxin system RelE/ParE family toxin [Acidobacteria bacterium]|nr:type II toxin-antitoxin system RelE/ParE family toxin [Acidobacteriota bacterium]